MELPFRLGQRVYGVTQRGLIVPTLISKIELRDAGDSQSAFERRFFEKVRGVEHEARPELNFLALNSQLVDVWLTFEEAHERALAVLSKLITNESLSVRENRQLHERLEKYASDRQAVQTAMNRPDQFPTTYDGFLTQEQAGQQELYRQTDFPQHYIEPGSPVWIADTKDWQLIRGVVTAVRFAVNWKRRLVYYCGKMSNHGVDTVFKTKNGALNHLDLQFKKTLPGTLDRKRVQVVMQLSESERKNLQTKHFRKVAEQMIDSGYFKEP